MNPKILTARLDSESQSFFDHLRERYFPSERNYIKAHLTLFHHLPDLPELFKMFDEQHYQPFTAQVESVRNIGYGVAFFMDSPELKDLHLHLQQKFQPYLTPQDLQRLRPHITIQNKVKPEQAKALSLQLKETFEPFSVSIVGLDLWDYLGGPWAHLRFFAFQ